MALKNTIMMLVCNMAFFVCSFAATVTWDGDAGDGDWMSPTNWDMDMIPTAADDVDLNSATVVLGTNTTVQRVLASGGSVDLTINVGVTLTITGFAGDDDGLEISSSTGTVTNNGTIAISNISADNADGLYVKGMFTNNGTITVDATGEHGIYVQGGTFTNNGMITITDFGQTDTARDGIILDDNGGTPATFNNDGGSISITVTSGDDGIYINDGSTFNNAATIDLFLGAGATGGDEVIFMENNSMLNNNSGGTITINSGDDYGIQIKSGCSINNNSGATLNIGAVPNHQIRMEAATTFTNGGTLNLTNGMNNGLYLVGEPTFTNTATGMISISGITGTDNYGIQIDGNNSGSPATLNNFGTITVANGSSDGVRMQEAGIFNNNAGATLTCNSTTGDDAIEMDNPSVFNNSGTIEILNSGDVGIDNQGDFNNMAGGLVNIDAIPDHQILLDATATFDNAGTIDLDGGAKNGFNITDASVFTNTATGVITIDGGSETGIQVDATGNAASPKFDNSGAITIQTMGVDGLRLRDNGIFNNLASGTVTINASVDEAIELNSETGDGEDINNLLTNENTITIDGSAGHGIQLAEGRIDNDGTITILDYGADGSDDGIRVEVGGILDNNAGATISITGDGNGDAAIELNTASTINNSGSIIISNADDDGLNSEGTFNNEAGALFQADGCVTDGIRMPAGTFNNDGDIRINNSADNDIETDGSTFNNSATATFAPGASPGLLEIRDNFDFGTSMITIEINGLTPITEFDRIENISGGTLTFSSATVELDWGTYIPEVGDEFRIVAGGGAVTGPFAMVNNSNPNISYMVNYDATGIEIEVTAVLPVELVDFSATKSNQGANLSWETATEINNEGFEIEKSYNNRDWMKIGYVNGNGNSNTAIQYDFLDNAPAAGTNYYRLKQNDFDGQFEYSRVVALDFENGKIEVATYPNPVEDVLYLDMNQDLDNVEIQIQDMNGKVLWTQQGIVKEIPFDAYSPGVYFLNIVSDSNRTVQRIIHN